MAAEGCMWPASSFNMALSLTLYQLYNVAWLNFEEFFDLRHLFWARRLRTLCYLWMGTYGSISTGR